MRLLASLSSLSLSEDARLSCVGTNRHAQIPFDCAQGRLSLGKERSLGMTDKLNVACAADGFCVYIELVSPA
jgi:hypothetical protein